MVGNSVDMPSPNRRSPGHPRQRGLLEAAVAAIREEGPGVSMSHIAERAGVGKPTLYRAFGSKAGLYGEIARWFISLIQQDLAAAISRHTSGGGIIRQAVDSALERISKDRNVYDFLMRRARMELSSARQRDEFIRDFGDSVARVFDAQMRAMGYDPAPAPVWARAIVGMTISVADWWLDHPECDRGWVVDQIMQIVWEGMKSYRIPARGSR